MDVLRYERVLPEHGNAAPVLRDWQRIHNLIIPPHQLTAEEIAERARRHQLDVAYSGGLAVGCSTVRRPVDASATATVIARVLPELRRQGFGDQIYQRALANAQDLGVREIETVVLASNEDGLRFAMRNGFIEVDRYVLPGETIPYVDLRLA